MKSPLNANVLLSHFVLNNKDTALDIAATESWKEDGEINFVIEANGVKIPEEVFESTLNKFLDHIEEYLAEKYNPELFDERVNAEVERKWKEFCEPVYEKLQDAANAMDNIIDADPWK